MSALSWVLLIMIIGGAAITTTLKYQERKCLKDLEAKSSE